GGAANGAVEDPPRDAVHGIREVRRLDHVVLLVAAKAVLRPERRREPHVATCRERVDRVRQVARHRRGMRDEPDPPAGQRAAKRRVVEQSIQTESHALGSRRMANASSWWKSGRPTGWKSAQYDARPLVAS